MRVYVNLSATEAIAASKGELRTLVRPLRKQPPEGYVKLDEDATTVAFGSNTPGNMDIETILKRFPIGCEIWGRETWSNLRYLHGETSWQKEIWYKADAPEGSFAWYSPVTMPSCAIRFKWVSKGSRGCQVNGLSTTNLDKNVAVWLARRYPIWKMPEPTINLDKNVAVWLARRYPKLDFDKAWVEVVEMEAVK